MVTLAVVALTSVWARCRRCVVLGCHMSKPHFSPLWAKWPADRGFTPITTEVPMCISVQELQKPLQKLAHLMACFLMWLQSLRWTDVSKRELAYMPWICLDILESIISPWLCYGMQIALYWLSYVIWIIPHWPSYGTQVVLSWLSYGSENIPSWFSYGAWITLSWLIYVNLGNDPTQIIDTAWTVSLCCVVMFSLFFCLKISCWHQLLTVSCKHKSLTLQKSRLSAIMVPDTEESLLHAFGLSFTECAHNISHWIL